MARARRRVVLGVAALVAAMLLEGAMLVWSGQPQAGATDAVVRHYYAAHWVAVVVGNLLWLPGTLLLTIVAVAGVHGYGREAPRRLRTTSVAVTAIGGALMVLSSMFALATVTVAQFAGAETIATVWSAEIGSFTVAILCWMVAAVLFAAVTASRNLAAAVVGIVVAMLLLVGIDIGWWALLTGTVLLGATTPDGSPPDKMAAWTSDSKIASTSSLVGRRG